MPSVAGWLSVDEAAERLNLHPQRIYPLLRDQRLRARRHGARWEIDPVSIARFGRVDRAPGRPLDPLKAWKVLAHVCSDKSPFHDRALSNPAINQLPSLGSIAPSRLRNRAKPRWFHAHPGLIENLASHVVVGGARALSEQAGLDKVLDDALEGYVRESQVQDLCARFKLDDLGQANVVFHVVDDAAWPFKRGVRQVPSCIAAFDLIESGDERSMRVGSLILSDLVDQ